MSDPKTHSEATTTGQRIIDALISSGVEYNGPIPLNGQRPHLGVNSVTLDFYPLGWKSILKRVVYLFWEIQTMFLWKKKKEKLSANRSTQEKDQLNEVGKEMRV